MARPRVHRYWIEKIRTIVRNRPELSAAAIQNILEEGMDQGQTALPSLRTVGAIKQQLVPEGRKDYRYFTWPDAMETGELPWEASRAALDLMRYAREELGMELMVREVRWFLRVTLAAPDAPMDERVRLAIELAMEEKDELSPALSEKGLTSIQWKLVYQPWRSAKDKKAWLKLPKELRTPLFHSTPSERSKFPDLSEGKKKKKMKE